jgi:ribosome recycling factor
MIEIVTFIEGDSKSFEQRVNQEMEKPIKHFERELAAIRTGRASTSVVEGIKVDCYGQMMPLKEVATLTAPDARLIIIQPWDKSVIGAIEKAIQMSDIGITPVNDGTIIRLQLPMMSESRRNDLVKTLHKKAEEGRVNVRNIRKEYHNQIREAEHKHTLSEDFAKRLSETLQKITDTFVKRVDEMAKKKENEIRLI